MEVIYKIDYGSETYGEVRKTQDGLYKCFITPLFGGEWIEEEAFIDKNEAIEYLKSLT
jgi:hypothetical protein